MYLFNHLFWIAITVKLQKESLLYWTRGTYNWKYHVIISKQKAILLSPSHHHLPVEFSNHRSVVWLWSRTFIFTFHFLFPPLSQIISSECSDWVLEAELMNSSTADANMETWKLGLHIAAVYVEWFLFIILDCIFSSQWKCYSRWGRGG